MHKSVSIIGAGLAGCEAALQLAQNGYRVKLYDAKPNMLLPAYSLSSFAELVCNNSLSPNNVESPLGLLVSELREMGSKMIEIAEKCRIEDMRYFAVDKKRFSFGVTQSLLSHNIQIINKSVTELPKDEHVILASGPLTNEKLIKNVAERFDIREYHFSDASSVIVDIESIDLKDPYITKINDDLYAVRIPDDVFIAFCNYINNVGCSNSTHSADADFNFEKCLSIERLAGISMTALKEARFTHPYQSGNCLLLRRENGLENGFILVGCMTTLRYTDQRTAFSLLPGFHNLSIIKYGRMHRNTFINSPQILDHFFKVKDKDVYIIGQLSGTDGYAPAISSGLVAAMRIIYRETIRPFPQETMIGGLAHYVSNGEIIDFQPMCASFSLIKSCGKASYFETSMKALKSFKDSLYAE